MDTLYGSAPCALRVCISGQPEFTNTCRHTHTSMSIHPYIYTYIHRSINQSIYLPTYLSVSIYVDLSISIYLYFNIFIWLPVIYSYRYLDLSLNYYNQVPCTVARPVRCVSASASVS